MYLLYIVKTILLNKPFLNYNSFNLKKRVYKTFNNNIKAQFVICLPSNSLFSFENSSSVLNTANTRLFANWWFEMCPALTPRKRDSEVPGPFERWPQASLGHTRSKSRSKDLEWPLGVSIIRPHCYYALFQISKCAPFGVRHFARVFARDSLTVVQTRALIWVWP